MRYPLDKHLEGINYMPYTISWVIRKRIQVDNFNELPKEKRPPERLLWEGSDKELDEWLKKVMKVGDNNKVSEGVFLDFSEDEVG